MERESQKKRDIKNILIVLGTAIFTACLVAFLFIFYYGPSGSYLGRDVLLNPSIIERINYQDNHPRTGLKVHFMFDRTVFTYFDVKKAKTENVNVPIDHYHLFYQMIASDKSLEKTPEAIISAFNRGQPAQLTTYMRVADTNPSSSRQIFQTVQFIEEDHYRVHLHGKKGKDDWAYFFHPQIYQEMIRLFNSEDLVHP